MSVSSWLRKEAWEGSRRISSPVRLKGKNALVEKDRSRAKIAKNRTYKDQVIKFKV